MRKHHFVASKSARHAQRGLSLIELLVAVAINLIIVIAVMYLYLGTRESQRALDQVAQANEVGVFALRSLGREVMNAGFYPSAGTEDGLTVITTYSRAREATVPTGAAYDSGIFGCEGAAFDVGAGACEATVANAADGLVVAYFTNDAFGAAGGQRVDCNGTDVGTATPNLPRVGAGASNQPPAKPLMVANHYRLGAPKEVVIDGQTVTMRSLECSGNASPDYQSVVAGIDDFQVTYGVYADEDRAPLRFYTATEVAALGPVTIKEKIVPAWGRVTSVRICVIARTYESAARQRDSTGATRAWKKCDGSTQAQAAGDQSIRKNYTQVFGMRNFLNATY